jgi:formylmethanofuran dehydrogenase subunit E
MSNHVWKIMRALAGVENGTNCRKCGESIHKQDPFGRSERVCDPCRNF